MSRRKVFVLSDGGYDYSAAEQFGDIVICSEGPLNKDDVAQMYRILNDAMLDAGEDDYILVSSLTSLCMVGAAIMASSFGRLNMLIFRDGRYIEKNVVLE